jgi:glycosyltransferase involved in cell wall biosynthesis
MSEVLATPSTGRIEARAKFFFDGQTKFWAQGVTYGPFRPADDDGIFFGDREKTERDFKLIRAAGFNLLRLYHVPPRWLLDLAREYGLRAIITVPWEKRVLFLDDRKTQRNIRNSVKEAAKAHAGHPALFGFYVDNEIPSDLVRWYGARKVESFLDSLVQVVKNEDEGALVAYANFPPTEYLLPRFVDFYSYNVYLHNPEILSNYLARLQNIAEDKPLMLGEFGMDTIRHSEEEQAALLESHYEVVFRAGLAGTIIFAWTDEWFTNGIDVDDWAFGLVAKDRRTKPAYEKIKSKILTAGGSVAEKYPLKDAPKASVVVCSYNGALTLRECLESLQQLNYPDYEVILVDDGSKDNTAEIAKDFPSVRYIHQPNLGLSVARNTGIDASLGEVVAFTDSDCMADRDWLYYLVQTLITGDWAAVGGPNISPPARDWIQASVGASPGSPSHVLLSDREAEHVPGCNMAFHKWALEMIGGFDPEYRKAGDDVDVCWRIMQRGFKIGFSPSALVWHHRRFTVKTYFKQQGGYGEAEALLRFKHLNYFDASGSARWRGTIYGQPRGEFSLAREVVYHGVFGTGFFQSIYRGSQPAWLGLVGSLEWVGLSLAVLLISLEIPVIRIVPLLMVAVTLIRAMMHMASARLEPRFDSVLARLLIFYLALSQPLVRGWARYFTWLKEKKTPSSVALSKEEMPHEPPPFFKSSQVSFWSESGGEREQLLAEAERVLDQEGWKFTIDTGWTNWDFQIFVNRWWHVRVRTLTEIYPHGRRLTRAGINLSPSTFSILFWASAGTVTLILALAYLITLVLILPILVVTFLYWISSGYALRYRIASLLSASATRVGMIPVKSNKG